VIDHSESGHTRLLKIKKKKYTEFSKTLAGVYQNEYKKAFVDELNNIYVSLTRAKYELYLYIPKKVSNKKNQACSLMPQDQITRGQHYRYKNTGVRSQPIVEVVPSCRKDWIMLLADEFGNASQIRNASRIQRGSALHEVLSHIGDLKGQEAGVVVARALEKTRRIFPDIDADDLRVTIEKLLSEKTIKPLFWVETGAVYCEKDIVDQGGNTKRIDRLIVSDKEVRVIDYKSSDEDYESQVSQVRQYMALMEDMYRPRLVRGFLVYLDDARLQEL
jgi:ATP-dependent helicase/nuclease subunit A